MHTRRGRRRSYIDWSHVIELKTFVSEFCDYTQVEAIRVLLSHHAGNIDAADKESQTPLMVAVRAQQQPSALVLAAAGADLNVSAKSDE